MRFYAFLILLVVCSCKKENKCVSSFKDYNSSQSLIKPNTKAELNPFIPHDFQILDFDFGDLNQDSLLDCIIALRRRNEESFNSEEIKRPLMILLRDSSGVLSPLIQNSNALYCYDCGGLLGDPFMTVEIKDNGFSIVHYGGGWFRWYISHYFSFKTDSSSFSLDSIRCMHGEVFADSVEAVVFQSELRIPTNTIVFESFNIKEDDFLSKLDIKKPST